MRIRGWEDARMDPVIAAAMAACLQHMSGGAWERDFEDCDRIAIEYNRQVETLTGTPAMVPVYSEVRSRQQDIDTVKAAAATLLK